jgi:hypothetical protein
MVHILSLTLTLLCKAVVVLLHIHVLYIYCVVFTLYFHVFLKIHYFALDQSYSTCYVVQEASSELALHSGQHEIQYTE